MDEPRAPGAPAPQAPYAEEGRSDFITPLNVRDPFALVMSPGQ